jgi:hypothetical protein
MVSGRCRLIDMMYEFMASDGDVIEASYPMSKAPDIGTPVKRNGKVFRRVISQCVSDGSAYDINSYPKISSTLPQFGDGAEHIGDKGSKHWGKCIIESQSHERDLCKRHGFTREYHHDDGP